jgi:ketosteroid isomerase-like protein
MVVLCASRSRRSWFRGVVVGLASAGVLLALPRAGLPGAGANGAAATASSPRAPVLAEPPAMSTREVAMRAFERFREGLATGRWAPWFEMLEDDFTFVFPTGKYLGRHTGKAKAVEFFKYVRSVYPDGLTVTLDQVTVEGSRALFEFRSEGALVLPTERRPYKNRVAVVMEFRGDRVVAYREYFGSDGKSY